MNNIVKFGLIGIGGYVLYKAFGEQFMGGDVAPTPGTTQVSANQPINTNNATNAATTTPQGNTPKTDTGYVGSLSTKITAQQLYNAINYPTGSKANPDQWSYAFSHSPGGYSIDPSLFDRAFGPVGSATRSKEYTVQEWIDIIKANGGTGLAGLSGLNGLTVMRPNYFERSAKWRM